MSPLARPLSPFVLLALAGCASDEPVWAVHHASFIPTETGLSGTQTWEFFSEDRAKSGDPDAFVCARAQLVTGSVVAALDGCAGCVATYELDVTELESDCADDLAADGDFVTPRAIAIGGNDNSALLGERAAGCGADATARARDDGDLAGEIEGPCHENVRSGSPAVR